MSRLAACVAALSVACLAIVGAPPAQAGAAAPAVTSGAAPSDCTAAPVATQAGPMYDCTFAGDAAAPARRYYVYVPPGLAPGAPLVVYLHGCTQNAIDAAYGAGWNVLASQQGFAVAYPQQTVSPPPGTPDGNGVACWNWFLPADQARDSGEPASIAGITREVAASVDSDPSRVFVDGISAGADMSVIMGAAYPDLYAAIGVVAGCAYSTCGDATGALTVAAMGSRRRVVPAYVEQGTADTLSPYALGQGLVQSWLGADSMISTAAGGGAVSMLPASTSTVPGQAPDPSAPGNDVCVHNGNFPCPGGAIGFKGSYPYVLAKYGDAAGCDILDFWAVQGLEHAYPQGGFGAAYDAVTGNGTFTDPLGPSATLSAWQFFAAHPRGACAGLDVAAPSLPETRAPILLVAVGLLVLAGLDARRRRTR